MAKTGTPLCISPGGEIRILRSCGYWQQRDVAWYFTLSWSLLCNDV